MSIWAWKIKIYKFAPFSHSSQKLGRLKSDKKGNILAKSHNLQQLNFKMSEDKLLLCESLYQIEFTVYFPSVGTHLTNSVQKACVWITSSLPISILYHKLTLLGSLVRYPSHCFLLSKILIRTAVPVQRHCFFREFRTIVLTRSICAHSSVKQRAIIIS